MMQEAANAASKLQSFLDLIERARLVLTAAANAEAQAQSLNNHIAAGQSELADLETKLTAKRDALAAANSLVDEAKARAATMLRDADSAAAAKTSDGERLLVKLKSDMETLTAASRETVVKAQDELRAVQSDTRLALSELADVKQRIADAKAAALAALS